MYAGTILDIAMIHSDSLIISAQRGDERAISKLVSLWHTRIYNFCLKYFGDHDIAMDATQKTFISMCNSISGLNDIGSFRSWLYKIATNSCHTELRQMNGKLRKDSMRIDEEEGIRFISDSAASPLEKMHQSDLSDLLMSLLQKLPTDQREVLIMKEYEGLKFREIAEILNQSENTVKSKMYYALGHIRKELDKRNINKESIVL